MVRKQAEDVVMSWPSVAELIDTGRDSFAGMVCSFTFNHEKRGQILGVAFRNGRIMAHVLVDEDDRWYMAGSVLCAPED